jgi:hypothetical protein
MPSSVPDLYFRYTCFAIPVYRIHCSSILVLLFRYTLFAVPVYWNCNSSILDLQIRYTWFAITVYWVCNSGIPDLPMRCTWFAVPVYLCYDYSILLSYVMLCALIIPYLSSSNLLLGLLQSGIGIRVSFWNI